MTLGCHLRGFYFSVQPQCGGPYLISRRPDHKESRRTKERVPFVPCVTVELGRVIFCCPWTETYAIRAPGSPGSYLRGNPPATSLGLRPADGGPWARPPGLRDCRSRCIITPHADERETQPWRIRLPRPLTLLLWRSLTTTAALTASGASVAFARTRPGFSRPPVGPDGRPETTRLLLHECVTHRPRALSPSRVPLCHVTCVRCPSPRLSPPPTTNLHKNRGARTDDVSWLGGTFPGSLTGPGPHSQLCSCLSYFTPKLGVTDPPSGGPSG